MKKVFLTSAMCMLCALPSYADIASSANSATCDNTTIGATEGNTNLEANWNANTITIDWYNGDTKITTNTCSYDGAVTIPATPTKAGYTFNGWKVRAVAVVPERVEVEDCYFINNEQDCENSYVSAPYCYADENDTRPCGWSNGMCRATGRTCTG